MAVPKKRKTSSAQGQKRAHHALIEKQLQPTSNGLLVPRRLKKAAELGLLKTATKA